MDIETKVYMALTALIAAGLGLCIFLYIVSI